MRNLRTALLFVLLALTAGCATFKEMARQRGEAMDACQRCACCQCGCAQSCGNKQVGR